MDNERDVVRPRNGHTLIVLVIARISGCEDQVETSNDDQVDHAKEVISDLYDGGVEYRITATVGKGESLDRPELEKIRSELVKREADFLIVEDLGRLVRGAEASNLFGLAVDNGTRCIAANDNVDTISPSWDVDALAACHDHVAHNAHTSSRIKQKKMNRFKKFGASIAIPIFGYVVPPGATTYADWQKDDCATAIIREGLEKLKATHNCSAVADLFNQKQTPVGKYCRRQRWDAKMVRRFYKNRILGGMVGRGFKHTVKKYKSGRRVSQTNPKGPTWREYPALAHVPLAELDEINAVLAERNKKLGRKPIDGKDPRKDVPKKRSRFLGQHGRCWYCGSHHVWGGNGIKDNLMCSASREWRCWCAQGYSGPLAVKKVVAAITAELYKVQGFDEQFRRIVAEAGKGVDAATATRLQTLQRDESKLATARSNLKRAIAEYGPNDLFAEQLAEFQAEEARIGNERRQLNGLRSRDLVLPTTVAELRPMFEQEMQGLALNSYDVVPLLNRLVPEFYIYLVRLCDGRECYPRARVTLALDALIPDAVHVAGFSELLRRVVTIDLFEPPQRERIRAEAVQLDNGQRSQAQIAALISEKPTTTAVQRALKLQKIMLERGLTNPYVLVENPTEGDSLTRHKNPKYVFTPVLGYERPSLL